MTPRTPVLLRRLAADTAADADLLARFVVSRDATAFELLVWRHAGMVLRVCRDILGDHHAAEDACQATFLALARQAGAIGRGSVAGWLYRVARRVAMRAKGRADRVGGSPTLLDQLPAPGPSSELDPTLIRALHDEVARLPERYRVPVLLCFFEGLTHQVAAERLGMPIGTLAARVARARDRLRRRLSARGFGASAGVLLTALTGGSAGATSPTPALVSAITAAAVAFATAADPGSSEAAVELARGVLRTMATAKIRWAVGVATVCVAVATGGLWVAGEEPSKPPQPPPLRSEPAPVGEPPFGFTTYRLEAENIVTALSLNIYKFQVEVPPDQQFHVVLRELDNKDAAPRELKRFTFQRGPKDGPTSMRIDFTRTTPGDVGGVLLTDQKEALFRVTCPGWQPFVMESVVPVPLSQVAPTKRDVVVHMSDKETRRVWEMKETRLLSIIVKGANPTNYPRAELVVEKP